MTAPHDSINGLLPHYVVAKTHAGYWAGFELTKDGYRKLTLTRYSPADAAIALADWLKQNEPVEAA